MINTRLSVNINKVALIRNSRGADFPNVVKFAKDCEQFGAQGITIHPRPDQRHATYQDIHDLKKVVTTELNIEGNPNRRFMDEVLAAKPHQVTLVPDATTALTSDAGWDTVANYDFLKEVTDEFAAAGIRVSIFVDPIAELGPHVAPLGIAFYDKSQFPEKFNDSLFVALHGSWNKYNGKSGYKVIFVKLDENGEYLYQEDFITGWLQNEKDWGRPVSPFIMNDGSLLISDDKYDVIYRIKYKG